MKYKFFTVTVPFILLIVGAFYFTASFIQPSPKKEITIATGGKTGNYYKTALKYKEILEKQQVKVNILNSAGSIENIQLLKDKKADIAFVQNGTISNEETSNIKSLASIYYEPLWVFYKNDGYPIEYIVQLFSKKISIGKIGSGTRDLAIDILKDNGMDSSNTQILDYTNKKAKEELLKGNIDAMFVVTSHKSDIVKELLESPDVNLLSFKRARAYSRKYTFLEDLPLYEGTLDLFKNLPDENVNLLSTTANLVANEDFPAELKRLFLKEIGQVHDKKDLFSKDDQFPNNLNMILEMDEDAQRYYEYGDTFLEKIFPYWIASNIDRLKILLIPLLTLLLPLFKGFFPLYNWSMRSKIYRWYEQIKEIDNVLSDSNIKDYDKELDKLKTLRKEISNETKVPLSYMGEYYNLMVHLDLIENKLKQK